MGLPSRICCGSGGGVVVSVVDRVERERGIDSLTASLDVELRKETCLPPCELIRERDAPLPLSKADLIETAGVCSFFVIVVVCVSACV